MRPTVTVLVIAILAGAAALFAAPSLAEDVDETKYVPPAPKAQRSARQRPDVLPRSGVSPTAAVDPAPGVIRIKNLADWQGVRGNQLVGYGLVVGLEGTGDGQSSQFTIQATVNMLRRFRINVSPDQVKFKNIAAVMVTADLPAFAHANSQIDVTVSSMGDAKSLQGGTLIQTPLLAANGEVYAVAQGALSIGGFNFGQGGSSVQKNHVAAGRIPKGAYVEQEVATTLTDGSTTSLTLRQPDFTTASRMADAIRRELPATGARAIDAGTVALSVPPDQAGNLVGFLAQVENVTVTPDNPARIVVNERTGTIVMSGDVHLAPGVIAHGNINIRVENTPVVVPAPPFSKNAPPPLVVPQKSTNVEEKGGQLAAVPATSTLDQLVRALNALGVSPRDLISILQGMHSKGMIYAEIEIQ
jgi:flagellar P-ring protein precursor FlgI